MAKYVVKYTVVIEAEDFDQAELLSVDLEGDFRGCSKKIKEVWSDPYMEKVSE